MFRYPQLQKERTSEVRCLCVGVIDRVGAY